MRQAENLTTGKVHLVTGENTYCGIKDVEEKVTLLLTECEEIRHDTVCEKCYVSYCKHVDSERDKLFSAKD